MTSVTSGSDDPVIRDAVHPHSPYIQIVYHREDASPWSELEALVRRFGAGSSSVAVETGSSVALETGSETRCRFRVRSRSAKTEQKLVSGDFRGQ